jgi:hypothetical protein
MAIENISQDVADLLATKDYNVKYTDGQGQDSSPEEAKTFAFDWVAGSGKNYGTVVIVLGDENDLQLFFGDNLGKTMENPQDKLDWFGSERETGFLPELKNFATQHRYTFSPKDINQLKHTMQGIAAIKEGLFEGYYGTRKISYVGEKTEARLVIKHNRMIGEDDKRYRYVESLFIETALGERFKLPFVKLSGGRAMLEHVKQGGKPYDIRGQHINEIVSEMAVLSRFNRASQQRVFEGVTQELVETAQHYYSELRGNLQHMATGRGYTQYFESWTPADIGDETALVEDLKTMFIEQTLDARIEAALPTLAKIQQRGTAMKEAQIFENWANNIMEGTWALPDTPEAQAKLNELMSQELIVGPDATNATQQLYDVIGDVQLFDILGELADQDPRANIWDDTDVQARLQELGIQMNTTPEADQQQPVAPAAGQQAPGTAPEQGVAEEVDTGQYDARKSNAKGATTPDQEKSFREKIKQYSKELEQRQKQKEQGVAEDDSLRIGSKLPQSDTETFGLEKGRGYKINNPEDWKPGDRPRAVQQLIPTQDKKDHIRSRLGKHAAPNLPEQAVAENAELATMLKYAGVPLRESVLTDSTGHTLDHILKRFGKEVSDFKAGGEITDDLYHALYDYYFDDMPYGTKKARDGDPYEWVSDRLADELGMNEGMLDEVDFDSLNQMASHAVNALGQGGAGVAAAATGAALGGLVGKGIEKTANYFQKKKQDKTYDELKQQAANESSCNMTMEGEYCPEHGLMECGMYEMGTVAGSMAPVVGEGTERDKFYYQRNDIWRVMDGDEVVDEYKPARYEVVGAKKLLAQYDDDNIDVTHVISPMGVVTYLYGKPEMDEAVIPDPKYDHEPPAQESDPIPDDQESDPIPDDEQEAYYESKADNALLARIKSLALLK